MELRAMLVGGCVLCGLAGTASAAPDACFEASARRYQLDARLLKAMARVESGMNPAAVNLTHRSRTKTVDIGLLQINSSWLPTLARYGIGQRELRDACTNIEVGAWILAGAVARHGNRWQAVGAYNAACTRLKGAACTAQRAAYAWKVYRHMARAPAGTRARTGTAAAGAARIATSSIQLLGVRGSS